MNILDELYHEMCIEKQPETAEYKEARERSYAIWEEAAEILGPEFSDQVWNNLVELSTIVSRHDFKEGFRLGVQMMSEARTPGDSACITVGTTDNILK